MHEVTPREAPTSGTKLKLYPPINTTMGRIVTEWMPSSGYEKSMNYELEVYGPGDTKSDDYICEIWIPVKKK